MLDWQGLTRLSDSELSRVDIALVNLRCAYGLPRTDEVGVDHYLQQLDDWAEQTRHFTDRMMPLFHCGTSDYSDSEPRFRLQAMITYLQRDLGIRFRPDKRDEDADLEPSDNFLHGILRGEGGTCGSLPVLYVAVGRRLGYPLKLAMTRCHLYVRWDDSPSGESFNIEASGDGVSFFSDEYYRTGRYAMASETIEACGYLKSLSPREELASFLVQRGECWMQERNYYQAVTSYAWANEVDPQREHHAFLTVQAMTEWDKQLRHEIPPKHFPKLDIGDSGRSFSRMPLEAERAMVRLRVVEALLRDPTNDRCWWEPLRRDPSQRPPGLPEMLRVDYRWNHH